MYNTILFDLDGTLTDPKEGITKSVQYALSACGIQVDNLDELLCFIGPPLIDSFEEYYGMSKDEAVFALKKYRERFSSIGIFENQMFEYVPKILSALKQAGKTVALSTSKPEVYAKRILDHFSITGYFDEICGCELDGTRNSKAEVIEETLKRLNNPDKKKVVMVGDRKHDIIGAKKCDITSIGIKIGYAEDGELEKAGADYIVDNLQELEKLLIQQ